MFADRIHRKDRYHPSGGLSMPLWLSAIITFGEATPAQRDRYYTLRANQAAAEEIATDADKRGYYMTSTDFITQEYQYDDQPLTHNGGSRVWCIYMTAEPDKVLSACRTVRRDFLINDKDGGSHEKGYCIGSVITDKDYRRRGLASALIQRVGEWLDGPGEAAVSILYTTCRSVRKTLRGGCQRPN
jgi:GNAT superfamily N-acetyltransferase